MVTSRALASPPPGSDPRSGGPLAHTAAGLATFALCLASCSGGTPPAPPPPPDPTRPVATGSAGGYTVRLLAAEPIAVGLNHLALDVEVAGSTGKVSDATLEFLPLFTTTVTDPALADLPHVSTAAGAALRCPVFGPGPAGADGRHPLRAVFQVPSGTGAWSGEVAVTRGGTTVRVPLSPLAVADPGLQWRLARAFTDGATAYVMALSFLSAPRVGEIPIAVTLHEARDSGMAFLPVADAALDVVPDMPEMSHGSTGGADPAFVSSGWYEGAANFTMPGWWVVEIPVRRGGAVVGAPAFGVHF